VLLQSSEHGVDDPHLLKSLESQVGTLGVSGLSRLQLVIQSRLSAEQRR
jgi:hypothetical protein